jgi:hypothetical protein
VATNKINCKKEDSNLLCSEYSASVDSQRPLQKLWMRYKKMREKYGLKKSVGWVRPKHMGRKDGKAKNTDDKSIKDNYFLEW